MIYLSAQGLDMDVVVTEIDNLSDLKLNVAVAAEYKGTIWVQPSAINFFYEVAE